MASNSPADHSDESLGEQSRKQSSEQSGEGSAEGPDATDATNAPGALAKRIDEYLAAHPAAAILEDGRVLFDLRLARYSVTESHGRCLLQLWSEEQNLVRTVLDARERAGSLRLTTRKMGAARPVTLEIVSSSQRRTPTSRDAAHKAYLRQIERSLARRFPDWSPESFRSAMDLEHSFGPAYARGAIRKGPMVEAVIGVGPAESAAAIDSILTLGILWLNHCREHGIGGKGAARHSHVGGLVVVVPTGAWRTTAERLPWLNHTLARFRLLTLDPVTEELAEVDTADSGNTATRLVHAFDTEAAMARAQPGIEEVLALVPEVAEDAADGAVSRAAIELRARSAGEVALLLHGLEFARVRQRPAANSFHRELDVSFGAGAHETPLNAESRDLCRRLLAQLFASRRPGGAVNDALYRMQPERWLESRLRLAMEDLMPGLRREFFYSQVPAISTGERGMLDLLTLDRQSRLTIIEVKAEEDLDLPLQGLDYWIRVRALNADRQMVAGRSLGAFERNGYFASGGQPVPVSELAPRLILIAPALRIHPANETVLRYLSPEVDWEMVAVGEDWRRELVISFRRQRQTTAS